MEIIDTHCHLDVVAFAPDRDAVLARARANGVGAIVVPGIQAGTWPRMLAFCQQHTDLYPALGLHPVFLPHHQDADLDTLAGLLAAGQVIAVGEIGLDYTIADLDHQRQQSLLEAQLELARDHDLPVLLHVRKAHDPMLATLKRIKVKGGIAHAFNGSLQQAQQYAGLGFKLGFGGMLTFPRSRRLRALARELPLENIVLETDAPDLTVMQHRGERNSPEYLPYCLAALAEVRAQDPAGVARQTTANARHVLGL